MKTMYPISADENGVGSNFIGRSILDALSFDDAVKRASSEHYVIAEENLYNALRRIC